MIVDLDREEVPNTESIPPEVLRYLVRKAEGAAARYRRLEDYYLGNHPILRQRGGTEEIRVAVNYAKYVVDTVLGYYLGDGIRYSVNAHANADGKAVDIRPLERSYHAQQIHEVDLELGRGMGIWGECMELCYASDEWDPQPRSVPIDPRCGVLVRDNSVEHRKLFALLWQRRENIGGETYYDVTVYTDRTIKHYRGGTAESAVFHQVGATGYHWFGAVPVIVYQNNRYRQGDFEQVISLIDAYNELMSSRLTDKRKFVDALLVFFGMTLREGDERRLAKEKFLDGAPLDARAEYIQKTFDEESVQVLADALVQEIHKMTMTVDMSDERFSGNSSGQALKLKLLTMNLLVKGKMRSMERGLKERFRLYNHYLEVKGQMDTVDTDDMEVVFTLNAPINEAEVVTMVRELQGIVDDETLLSQLWFIRDPAEALANIRAQREQEGA